MVSTETYDEIIKAGNDRRKNRNRTTTQKTLSLDNEALEWLQIVAKSNRKRHRAPNNVSAVASRIILASKARVIAKRKIKRDKT